MSEPIDIGLAIIIDPTKHFTVVGVRSDGVHLGGMQEFPGGKVEAGETPEECAVREAKEETGLDVVVIESWSGIIFEYPDKSVRLRPYLCVADLGLSLNTPWEWVEIDSLDEKKFPEANGELIERLRRILRK
jgi:8-oxo-dGTP diphosphatase